MNIENLWKAKFEDLQNIYGVGDVVASSVVEFFADKKNIELVSRLLKQVEILAPKKKNATELPLAGKTFVLTGTLQSLSRDEAAQKIRDLGGDPSGSVSKNTDYLVAGESAGSKYEKALDLGVKILNEEEFLRLIDKL